MVEIMSLFQKARDNERIRYTCDIQCPICKEWRVEECGRQKVSQVISSVKSGEEIRCQWRFFCAACKKAEDEARERAYDPNHLEKVMHQLKTEEGEKARLRTPVFIETFLDTRRTWNAEVSDARRFETMTREPIDHAMLSTAICQMTSEVFFRTPYWIAVRGEALRRAGGTCSQCGSSTPLTVRVRKPGWKGVAHTEEGLREILCLCERCKNTHMLVSNSQN